ncbi:uncharacterized protein E5676_scaffold236G00360 [Cucumis melo var. makuwa]|uniref:Uncharacterized protein n=1 Tax=Cucumis melo var. makuwa TaxID=1194695 RepID=A0A5D3DU59_CUCMM|nr:uncharacterized protein E6C27_scaffold61G002420 [Cucumis melo var. makuwa]TYK27183.1 uncharacterized protein E5676_scaffold236G00360 [Cucumis melo var. makuwa]
MEGALFFTYVMKFFSKKSLKCGVRIWFNFDVDNAVHKLEKLGIVVWDANGAYSCVDLGSANKIIRHHQEIVPKAKEGDATTT